MLKRIHVNQHIIRANKKREPADREPPITVKAGRGGKNQRANEVFIYGPSRVVYSPDKPLSCGATVWVETTAPVVVPDGERIP